MLIFGRSIGPLSKIQRLRPRFPMKVSDSRFSRRLTAVGIAVFFLLTTCPATAQLSVPLTVQEALYPGAPSHGINRDQEPVTVGIPLADSEGIKSESQLGLSGASVGQFRILGRWPSGNAKWVLVDTQADVNAGKLNRRIALVRGNGNFGGPSLAVDQGAAVSVNTGPAQFLIRKARFNGLERVIVDGKTLIASDSSPGLVIFGPRAGRTSCDASSPCTTLYASRNDAGSTAVIEENGPARAVVKAMGTHYDNVGHAYMHFTVRLFFYKGKSYVKAQVVLRNADQASASGFNSAYKGFSAYELQLTPALGGGRHFTIGTHTGSAVQGEVPDGGDTYLYQAYSDNLESYHWRNPDTSRVVSYIVRKPSGLPGPEEWKYAQEGYEIVRGSALLASGNKKQYAAGWADLSDQTGAGILVGHYQMAAYWPKSIQFESGGSQIRIGIWPEQSLFRSSGAGIPYYQAWPQYSIHDIYLNFHAAGLRSPGQEFLKFQHPLLARAPVSYYNLTKVFFYPLLESSREDAYYKSVGIACCLQDIQPTVFRSYSWGQGGGDNQAEFRWAYLLQWITRGLPGRYLWAQQFERFLAEQAFPRSDGFQWRDHPMGELDAYGFPGNIRSPNQELAHHAWADQEHGHWYGIFDYYFMSGDESVKEQILDGILDRLLNPHTILNHGGLWNSRAIGCDLMAQARAAQFLFAIGKAEEAKEALQVGEQTLNLQVFPELNVSGFGTGNPIPGGSEGISRIRGVAYGCCSGVNLQSDGINDPAARSAQPFMSSILIEGMWEYAQVRGPSWPRYQELLDLAYGLGQWSLQEMFVRSGDWKTSGFRYLEVLDRPNRNISEFQVAIIETVWFPFYITYQYTGDTSWRNDFETELRKESGSNGTNWSEFATYGVTSLVNSILDPDRPRLVDVPLKAALAGDSYTLSWTLPAGTVAYRIKYTNDGKDIVDWVKFDPSSQTFIGDPNKTWPWFAATDLRANSGVPLPLPAGGATQSYRFRPSAPGHYRFAMKAYVRHLTEQAKVPR